MAFKLDKKILIHSAAGVGAVILLMFGISQCNGKSSAEDERDAVVANCDSVVAQRDSIVSQATDVINQARRQIADLRNANRNLTEVNEQQGDSIVVLNDSIGVLNDSIVHLNDQLIDCQERNRRAPVTPVKKKQGQGGKKKQPVARRDGDGAHGTVVRDTVRKREVTVPVATPGGNNVIVNGDNSGQIIINNGGIVTGNGIVNNTYVNARNVDAEKKAQQLRDTTVVLKIRRYRMITR